MSDGKKAGRVAQLCGVQLWDKILWEQFRLRFFLTAVRFTDFWVYFSIVISLGLVMFPRLRFR